MIEYQFGKKGNSILMIHGWMHSARIYERLAQKLCPHYQVTLIDLPGFGANRDPIIRKKPVLRGLCNEVSRYLKRNQFDLIIAHSMGAAIILRLLNCGTIKPGQKILLLSPAYRGIHKFGIISHLTPLTHLVFRLASLLPKFISHPTIWLFSNFTINEFSKINYLIIEDAKRANPYMASQLLFEMNRDRWRFKHKTHQCEVRIVGGEDDRVVTTAKLIQLHKDLGAPLKILPATGHTTVLEAPERLLNTIYEMV